MLRWTQLSWSCVHKPSETSFILVTMVCVTVLHSILLQVRPEVYELRTSNVLASYWFIPSTSPISALHE